MRDYEVGKVRKEDGIGFEDLGWTLLIYQRAMAEIRTARKRSSH